MVGSKQKTKKCEFPVGESNPGLPRSEQTAGRLTGGYTDHYTNRELMNIEEKVINKNIRWLWAWIGYGMNENTSFDSFSYENSSTPIPEEMLILLTSLCQIVQSRIEIKN